MARSEPRINQIADRLVELLATIREDQSSYWTEPVTVMRGLPADAVKRPQPALFVTVGPVTPTESMNNQWRETAELIVVCMTSEMADPETALQRLVQDVRRMVRDNRLLANAAGTQLARYLREGPVGEEAVNRPSGLGVTTVTVVVDYQTDADNP